MSRGSGWGALAALLVGAPLVLLGFDRLVYAGLTSRLPVAAQQRLAMSDRPLAQASKSGALPAGDWIALLGDGQVLGQGDGMLAALESGGTPMTAALALHRALNRDALSLGAPEGGPIQAAAALFGTLEESRATPHPLPAPKTALIFFHEGDDAADLITFVRETVEGDQGFSTLLNHPAMQAQLGSMIAEMRGTPIEDGIWRALTEDLAGRLPEAWEKQWPGLSFLKRLKEPPPPALTRLEAKRGQPAPPAGTVNKARFEGERELFLPDRLPAPPLTMEGGELQFAARIFSSTLAYLRKNFPETDWRVVYLPSAVNAYAMTGDQVFIQHDGKGWKERYDREEAVHVGRRLCDLVARTSREAGVGFFDALPALRAQSQKGPIHGPRDWTHLNPQGAEALGKALAGHLKENGPARGCAPV